MFRRRRRRNPVRGKELLIAGIISVSAYLLAKSLPTTGSEEGDRFKELVANHPVATALGVGGLVLLYHTPDK